MFVCLFVQWRSVSLRRLRVTDWSLAVDFLSTRNTESLVRNPLLISSLICSCLKLVSAFVHVFKFSDASGCLLTVKCRWHLLVGCQKTRICRRSVTVNRLHVANRLIQPHALSKCMPLVKFPVCSADKYHLEVRWLR